MAATVGHTVARCTVLTAGWSPSLVDREDRLGAGRMMALNREELKLPWMKQRIVAPPKLVMVAISFGFFPNVFPNVDTEAQSMITLGSTH